MKILSSRSYLMVLALLMGLALVLSACAEDEDPEDVAEDPEEEPDEDPEEDPEEGPDEDSVGHFEGETIQFVHGHAVGGGYEAYAMLIESCLEEELGATVVVEAEPGAGGLVAANATWNAEPDGLRIQHLNGVGTIGAVLGEAEGTEGFELEGFTHLGRMAAEPRLLSVGEHVGYETLEDLIEDQPQDLHFAASGPGGTTYQDAQLMMAGLGLPFNVVTGFDGTADGVVSVAAGETDAMAATQGSMLPPIQAGDVIPLASVFSERTDALPDVPTFDEVVDYEGEQEQIWNAHLALSELGRLIIGPPDMDEDITTELVDALRYCIDESPEVAEAAETQDRPTLWAEPETVLERLADVLDPPDVVREVFQVEEED